MERNTTVGKGRTQGRVITFRPLHIEPLIEKWQRKNPDKDISELLRDSILLNPVIRELAGKRLAHLVEA